MGSFNTTCAVSRAPIQEGDKVRVFFLVRQTFSMHHFQRFKGLFSDTLMGASSYPWKHFHIFGYPLLGTYCDYNDYEFEDGAMSDLMLSMINDIYIPNEVKEGFKKEDYNSKRDHLNIKTIKNMKQFQDMEHDGAIRVKSSHGLSYISKMAILEDVYQMLILGKGQMDFQGNMMTDFSSFEQDVKDDKKKLIGDNIFDHLPDYKKEILNKQSDIGMEDRTEEQKLAWRKELTKWAVADSFKEQFDRFFEKFDLVQHLDTYSDPDSLIESWRGMQYTARYFLNNNLDFLPPVFAGENYSYDDSVQFHLNIAHVLSKSSHQDEDDFPAIKTFSTQVALSLKEITKTIKDWTNCTGDMYNEFLTLMDAFKSGDSFVKDESHIFGSFLIKYGILTNINNGVVIHLLD